MRSRRSSVVPSSSRRWKIRLFVLLFPIVAIAIWLGYKQFQSWITQPEAILVLGGHEDRERFAAKLAQQHPSLPIWVSSGSPKGYATKIFANEGIERDRIHLDYRALDTVTNFTTLVNDFETLGIDSVYLITSENHMRRSRIIGEIVFGSRGIILKPIAVPSNAPEESVKKCLRDGARALIWVMTGETGEEFRHSLKGTANLMQEP